jgi:hypothetical protein
VIEDGFPVDQSDPDKRRLEIPYSLSARWRFQSLSLQESHRIEASPMLSGDSSGIDWHMLLPANNPRNMFIQIFRTLSTTPLTRGR